MAASVANGEIDAALSPLKICQNFGDIVALVVSSSEMPMVLFVNYAEIHPMRFGDFHNIRCTLVAESNGKRVRSNVVRSDMSFVLPDAAT